MSLNCRNPVKRALDLRFQIVDLRSQIDICRILINEILSWLGRFDSHLARIARLPDYGKAGIRFRGI